LQALLAFAQTHGLPQRIQAVGAHAVRTCELFRSAVQEAADDDAAATGGAAEPLQQGSIVKWVVFDRGADLCTPVMSQLTMEGRLDELQGTGAATGWLPGERGAGANRTVHRKTSLICVHADRRCLAATWSSAVSLSCGQHAALMCHLRSVMS
jgi:hypothetical protein